MRNQILDRARLLTKGRLGLWLGFSSLSNSKKQVEFALWSIRGWSYTRILTFHSLIPSGQSITWKVQWKLFSTNIKSYLGAFKTQQIYFFKRSLFACLRELHFIYSADINWCTGSSKTVYIHSKIHFCDTTELVQSQGLFELCLSPSLCGCYSVFTMSGVSLATHPGLRPQPAGSIQTALPIHFSEMPGNAILGSYRRPDP